MSHLKTAASLTAGPGRSGPEGARDTAELESSGPLDVARAFGRRAVQAFARAARALLETAFDPALSLRGPIASGRVPDLRGLHRWSRKPTSPAEMERAVMDGSAHAKHLKATAAQRAMSDIRMTSGVLIDMLAHSAVDRPDRVSGTLSFNAGAPIAALNAALGADRPLLVGQALINQPGHAGLSFVGCMSVGGHGSGVRFGALASQAEAMRIIGVKTDGTPRIIELTKGDEHWRAATVGLGLVGLIERLTIRIQNGFRIRERRTSTSIQDVSRRLETLLAWNASATDDGGLGIPHSFEIWFNPYTGRAALGQRWMTMDPVVGRRRLAQRSHGWGALELGFDVFDTYGVDGRFGQVDRVADILDAAIAGVVHERDRRLVMTAAEGLDFAAPNHYDTVAAAVGVPVERCLDAVSAITVMCEELREVSPSHGGPLYVSSPIGVRFVKGQGGEHPFLAPQFDGLTAMIELPCLATVRSSERVLSRLLRMLVCDFGARPHWGQFLPQWFGGAELRRVYGDENVDAFREARRALDPTGAFDNGFARRLGLVV